MREDIAMYSMLALGIALVVLGFVGRFGVELAALLSPLALEEA